VSELRTHLQRALDGAFALERELYTSDSTRSFVANDLAGGRQVVLRRVDAEGSTRSSIERFLREVKRLGRLQHRNIVPVSSAGEHAGVLYYTMPFIDAPTLRERMATGTPVSLSESMHVLRDVATAMVYAHAQGVVHGDLRPERVLVAGGTTMLTDLGIVPAMVGSRLMPRQSLGSPAYLAPEQVAGAVGDSRADLYAWGVMAYELVTGAHPFARHTTPQALRDAHRLHAPAPIGRGNPSLPAALARVVMRCLAKEPDKRPLSAADLLVALDNSARPQATPVGLMTTAELATDTRPSRKRGGWLAVALLCASIAAAGWFLLQRTR
jgi:serine/threonine protein kinase